MITSRKVGRCSLIGRMEKSEMRACSKVILILVIFVFVTSCENDDNGNDNGEDIGVDVLTEFRCKPCGQSLDAFTVEDSSIYQGLQCASWQYHVTGQLYLDFVNFPAGCTPELGHLWLGSAHFEKPDYLKLGSTWNSETANACGSRLYQWSFSMNKIDTPGSLNVDFFVKSCGQCDKETFSMTLPVKFLSNGIVCRYMPGAGGLMDEIPLGDLNMPPLSGEFCKQGLVLASAPEGEKVCAAVCETDQECPLQPLLSCQNGACMLTDPSAIR